MQHTLFRLLLADSPVQLNGMHPSEILEYSVPKFFLQPLIENALVHGFSNIDYMGILKIDAYLKDGNSYFVVEDNGSGIDQSIIDSIYNDKGKAVGINNVRYRIKYVYGDQYEMKIVSVPNQRTNFTIVIPA